MRRVCVVAVNIRSAHNVGSLFRTCDGFRAELILVGISPRPAGGLADDRLPHITDKAHKAIAKTALGAEQNVDWKFFATVEQAITVLRKEGFLIAAIEQSQNSTPINNMNPNDNIALVLGPEVEGLRSDILTLCDTIYEIPMIGSKESFNVSIAAAIALYQARKLVT